ncbi:hypothetical protein D3C75_1326870 [compost metagenome]
MRPLLDQATLTNDRDTVGIANGRQAMGDDDGGATFAKSTKRSLYSTLGIDVDS